MTTPKRPWYNGAVYHVTARGNRRDDIFKDTEDFLVYLYRIEEALEYYKEHNYKIAAYCLMTNHVHLIIKTDTEPLGLLISRIHSIYTKYFNKKHGYVGHLFQDKYFGELIKDEAQLLETSRYVHLNPVNALMVDSPEDYSWSSYNVMIGNENQQLVDTDILLEYFKSEEKFEKYKEFIELKTPGGHEGVIG
ncbi:MAG: transposase [Romboutsia sp.]|uniref:transposase n=1 Tax=Romboutsia sp. TaxID=1965302 RepID=UPI003F3072B5